jgi:hypothetical protein
MWKTLYQQRLEHFYKGKACKGGLRPECKICIAKKVKSTMKKIKSGSESVQTNITQTTKKKAGISSQTSGRKDHSMMQFIMKKIKAKYYKIKQHIVIEINIGNKQENGIIKNTPLIQLTNSNIFSKDDFQNYSKGR